MAEEVIGSGFKDSVKKQLKARENLVSEQQKSQKHLLYFNSNSAWVRLSSSINTLSIDEVADLLQSKDGSIFQDKGSNNLAKKNVLKNGLTENRNGLKGGIDRTKDYNPTDLGQGGSARGAENYFPLTEGDSKTSTYHNYKSLGFRPEPGIQSVSVKSKGDFGTIREAEVSATVWTLEDLELIQALYLRPGYSVLLEWGHTVWIDNDNQLNYTIYNYNGFVEGKKNQTAIYEQLIDNRNKSDNNYDAMYGYVTNFSWSFRQDGGYDVTIKVISRGSILESIAATFDPQARLPNTNFRTTVDDEGEGYLERLSVFHKFALELKELSNSPRAVQKSELDNDNARDFFNELQNFTAFNFKQKLDGSGPWYWFDEEVVSFIVPLRTILELFNKFATLVDRTQKGVDKKILKFYTGENEGSGNYVEKSKFLTSKYHFSRDPMVCVLPKPPAELSVDGDSKKVGFVSRVVNRGFDHDKIRDSITRGETDDILNIYVGMYRFLEKVQEAYEDDKPEKGFLIILQDLLDDINDVLGGVNELDIHYDEDQNLHYVVDRALTPKQTKEQSRINLTGLESIISNLDVSSKISSEIASQVSIAAQGSSGNYKDSVEAMLKWNQGLIDRHTPDKSTTDDSGGTGDSGGTEDTRKTKKKKRIKDFAEKVEDVFDDFRNNDYDTGKFKKLKSFHPEFCNQFVVKEYYKDRSEPKPVPGLIPIELSFDIIGIAGLKIGQAFIVSRGILPRKYTDNFGFLITELDHKIENSKWITSVKTQFYSIK